MGRLSYRFLLNIFVIMKFIENSLKITLCYEFFKMCVFLLKLILFGYIQLYRVS